MDQYQYLGQLMLFAGNFAPNGWALCNGQLLAVNQYQALFSILGTTYGGNGTTNFALPDLRGRAACHAGQGANLTAVKLGQSYGTETNSLTTLQMPEHTHIASGTFAVAASSGADEDSESPAGTYLRATPGTSTYASTPSGIMGTSPLTTFSATVAQTGQSNPIYNVQPSLALVYCICLSGIFPSRQ